MPILQFKGKTAVESYHRVVPHHTLEIDPDPKFSLAKKPSLDGNLIIEGDNLIALKSLLPTQAGRIKCIYIDPSRAVLEFEEVEARLSQESDEVSPSPRGRGQG